MDWIPVTERIPDDDLIVLVYCPRDSDPVWIGCHTEGEWQYASGVVCVPSHWMELPEGPNSL